MIFNIIFNHFYDWDQANFNISVNGDILDFKNYDIHYTWNNTKKLTMIS